MRRWPKAAWHRRRQCHVVWESGHRGTERLKRCAAQEMPSLSRSRARRHSAFRLACLPALVQCAADFWIPDATDRGRRNCRTGSCAVVITPASCSAATQLSRSRHISTRGLAWVAPHPRGRTTVAKGSSSLRPIIRRPAVRSAKLPAAQRLGAHVDLRPRSPLLDCRAPRLRLDRCPAGAGTQDLQSLQARGSPRSSKAGGSVVARGLTLCGDLDLSGARVEGLFECRGCTLSGRLLAAEAVFREHRRSQRDACREARRHAGRQVRAACGVRRRSRRLADDVRRARRLLARDVPGARRIRPSGI